MNSTSFLRRGTSATEPFMMPLMSTAKTSNVKSSF